jgi:hypothetical protein
MKLKAGNYKIEFKFEPKSYSMGNIIALASSILLIISILIYLFLKFKSGKSTTV